MTASAPSPSGSPKDWIRLVAGTVLVFGGMLWTLSNEIGAVQNHRQRFRIHDQALAIGSERLLDLENGTLVCMAGSTVPSPPLSDPEFDAMAQALHMRRVVEFLQWTETRVNGELVYQQHWTDAPVDSDTFEQPDGHHNPPPSHPPPGPWTDTARKVSLGSFQLSPPLIRQIQNFTEWNPEQMIPPNGWHARGRYFLQAGDPDIPAPGDIRVSFEIVPPGPVTVLAGLEDNLLQPWRDPWLGSLYRVEAGDWTLDALLPPPDPAPWFRIWGNRLLSFLTQALGFLWMTGPLLERLLHVPAVWWARTGPRWSLVASLVLSLLIAALSWVLRNPVFSVSILLVFVLAGIVCVLQIRGLKFRTP